MRRLTGLLLAVTLFAVNTPAQYRRSRSPNSTAPSKDEPLPTFRGTFHSTAKDKLIVDTESGNQLEFEITRKTVFMEGDRKVKPDSIKQGTQVGVEAKRIIATRMEAVIVRVEGERRPAERDK